MTTAYRRGFVGEIVEGLVEGEPAGAGRLQAITDRYLKVEFDAPTDDRELAGQVVRLRIDNLDEKGLHGSLSGSSLGGMAACRPC